MNKPLTVDQLKAALPKGMKKQINPLLVMKINNTLTNPEEYAMYKENLISYASVLKEGRFKMSQYLNAVRYVGFKVMGRTNTESYKRTFPDKYAMWEMEDRPQKEKASYITAYNKSKLVNLILEQTLIPTHILNAPVFQQAINEQAKIMMDKDVSAKVRSDACNSLMTHLKPPEEKKVELDIGLKDDGLLKELKDITLNLAANQRRAIELGINSPKEIAQQKIITGEVIDG